MNPNTAENAPVANANSGAIHEVLQQRGPKTVTELAKVVDLSREDVLAALVSGRDLLFAEVVPPRTGKRGRPQAPRWNAL